jgi:hypothetical protein
VILPDHQRDIDSLIIERQRMLAEGAALTGAPASPTRERPDVNLTEVNDAQDAWCRCMLVTCEILQRGNRKAVGIPEHDPGTGAIACVMSAEGYERILKRLNHEQQDAKARALSEKRHIDDLIRRAALPPLVQNWPQPGPWSFPC